MTTSVVESQTAKPSGSSTQALWVATHSQKVSSLISSYPSAKVQLVYSTALIDRERILIEYQLTNIVAYWPLIESDVPAE